MNPITAENSFAQYLLYIDSFDIFVLSSHLEGLGTTILDAQAVGLPVVACKTGGIPEAVEDNINGLLVPTRNPEAMADAILDLARYKRKRLEFGKNAKETVKQFAIEKTVQNNIELYEQLFQIRDIK